MQQDQQEHQRRAERIETLVQDIASFPDPHTRAITEELLQTLLDMYGEGLSRILDLTAQSNESGYALIETFASDDFLASLFMLHDLHPASIETRVTSALVEVRPYLHSHGGNVELIKIEDGIAYVRLEGSCHGCSASTITLKQTIEAAIYKAAPDLNRIEVEGTTELPTVTARAAVPVTFVPKKRSKVSS